MNETNKSMSPTSPTRDMRSLSSPDPNTLLNAGISFCSPCQSTVSVSSTSVVNTPSPSSDASPKGIVNNVESHKCYNILVGGRTRGLHDQAYRVKLLKDVLQLKRSSILHESLLKCADVKDFFETYSSMKKNAFNNTLIATALCKLDMLRQQSQSECATSNHSIPSAISAFEEFMQTAANCALNTEAKKRTTGQKKVYGRQTGALIQHSQIFDEKKLEAEPCTFCSHRVLLRVGLDAVAITVHNNKVTQEYKKDYEDWQNNGQSDKKKPRKKATLSQQYACYCINQHCRGRTDGAGCRTCKNAAAVNDGVNPFLNTTTMKCECEECNCQYSAKYFHHEIDLIARQLKEKEEEKKQKELNEKHRHMGGITVQDFMSRVESNASKYYFSQKKHGMTEDDAKQNTWAMVTNDIASSHELWQDTNLRNSMQMEYGELTPYVGGVHINEKRREAKKLRKQKAMAHLAMDPNNRGYRNRLCKDILATMNKPPIAKTDLCATSSSDNSPSSYCNENPPTKKLKSYHNQTSNGDNDGGSNQYINEIIDEVLNRDQIAGMNGLVERIISRVESSTEYNIMISSFRTGRDVKTCVDQLIAICISHD